MAVISRDHLTAVGETPTFWDSTELEDKIARSYPGDYGLQKQECLEVWKEERGERHVPSLISAAEEARDKELADNIRDMSKKT
ncbi:hypothetical protein GBAR_LOCUS10589 [Geodia barretti]|uniref:Uncharacterized protein n=1 Tax=Geodia barretti TaxID=519541 RepID=A0AA35RTJ6_GEOBA|nr:hypothetical protein GBAR_LOCUS10589 [Geodia barretti]